MFRSTSSELHVRLMYFSYFLFFSSFIIWLISFSVCLFVVEDKRKPPGGAVRREM